MSPSTPTSAQKKSGDGGSYYAWSNFPVEYDEHGVVTKTIAVGDSVSQGDLDISDEEWEYLIETGAVSEDEYPDIPDHVSPAEYEQQMDFHGALESQLADHQATMEATMEGDSPNVTDTNAGGEPFVDTADVPPETADDKADTTATKPAGKG
jgi:hypothetical protein